MTVQIVPVPKANPTVPSDFYVEASPSSDPLEWGMCRALLCSEDGALNLTDNSGDVRENVPVQKGYNPLRASVVDDPSTGSAPGTVYVLY